MASGPQVRSSALTFRSVTIGKVGQSRNVYGLCLFISLLMKCRDNSVVTTPDQTRDPFNLSQDVILTLRGYSQ